jgi:hypothetical protein
MFLIIQIPSQSQQADTLALAIDIQDVEHGFN